MNPFGLHWVLKWYRNYLRNDMCFVITIFIYNIRLARASHCRPAQGGGKKEGEDMDVVESPGHNKDTPTDAAD